MVGFCGEHTGCCRRQTVEPLPSYLIFLAAYFTRQGRAVKLEGLGTYAPTVDLDGNFKISHRADIALKNALNVKGAFNGEIENRENIGKTSDELVDMWNTDHTDDLVS